MTDRMLNPTTVTGISADSELIENMKILDQELLKNHRIDLSLYNKYDVKRGLRDSTGKGVLTGLTEISDVVAYDFSTDKRIPIDGELYYQGCNVMDIIKGLEGRRFGFEEVIYLLLFGKLPNEEDLIMKKHRVQKNVCANVDFYSGFVYTMLGIPEELFTPIFAIARVPGWSAHRLEELLNGNRIIRPAYRYVGQHVDTIPISARV